MSETGKEETEYSDIDNKLIQILEDTITELDRPDWKEKYGSELNTVRQTHTDLTRSYYFMSISMIKGTIVLLLGILVIDLFMGLQNLIYGLSVNIWGTMFIIYPSLRGRYVITSVVESVSEEVTRELEIKKMVSKNIGFCLLILGFALQIFAHQSEYSQVISTNYLHQILPEWTVFIFILIVFYLASIAVSR